MENAISEIVGEGELKSGRNVQVYRALRSLLCSTCGALIAEGGLFIRRRVKGIGLRIMPQCQKCAPFTLREDKREKSALLESLLKKEPPDSSKGSHAHSSTELSKKQEEKNLDEEVKRRLGPALKRGRRGGRM